MEGGTTTWCGQHKRCCAVFLAGTTSGKIAQNESNLTTQEILINSSSVRRLSQKEESSLPRLVVASPRKRLL